MGPLSRCLALLAVLALGAATPGCVTPMPRGQKIIVDRRAGPVFSGEGVLLEVSQDRQYCRVAVRDNTLRVQERWVACRYVHGEGDIGI